MKKSGKKRGKKGGKDWRFVRLEKTSFSKTVNPLPLKSLKNDERKEKKRKEKNEQQTDQLK